MLHNPLPVNEIFSSIQGEGAHTGRPAVFVRLQSCPVGCPFCDTKHTWEKHPDREIPFDTMMRKTADADTWSNVGLDRLCGYLGAQPEKLIVITGGEPCLYALGEITSTLIAMDKDVQIETSGTEIVRADMETWITVSPKLDMPGGKGVLVQPLCIADEIKMPIGKQADVDKLKGLLAFRAQHEKAEIPVWLQPLSQSPKATELCIEQARLNGWRLSAQLHKYINVR